MQDHSKNLQTILDLLPDPVLTLDRHGHITYHNLPARTWLHLNHHSANKPLAECCRLTAGAMSDVPLDWAAAAARARNDAPGHLHLRSADGSRAAGRLAVMNHGFILTINTEALADNQQIGPHNYRSMIETMHDMVYMCTPDYHLQYLNPALRAHIGGDATGELCHKAIYRRDTPCPWCAGMPPPGQTVQCETTCPDTGRTSRIACASLGEAEARMVIVSNITDHKRAELALQESETRYKRLVASVTDYIYTVKIENGQAVSTFHGPGCIAVTGYSTVEYENDPDLWYKMVHMDDRRRVLEQTARLLGGQAIQPFEHRIIHKNGRIRWVRNTPVPHRNALGVLVAYDGMITDITERKLAEAQISDHARKLEIINRIIIAVNKADNLASMLEEMLHSSLDLLQFHSGCIYLMKEDSRTAEMRCASGMPADFINSMAQIDREHDAEDFFTAGGQAMFCENCAMVSPAMAQRWNFAALARIPLMFKDQTIGMLVIAAGRAHHFSENERELLQSIARQMGTALAKTRSEIALRESENRYRTITEQSLVGIQIIQDGHLIFINEGWTEITGYTRQDIESWNDRDFIRIVHPEDQQFFMEQMQSRQTGQTGGQTAVYDCRFISRTGVTKWLALHSKTILFAHGNAVMVIIVDITDRKLAEQALESANRRLKSREELLRATNQQLQAINEQLKASQLDLLQANRDKEMLFKEIHHRVKNNLQVISSLLKLQMGHVDDEKALQVIRDCQNRIKSIAIVHEKLYQTSNFAEIDISEYIHSLIKHLFRTFLVDPASIHTQIDVESVALSIDKAIPCSLVINELVSNSLKYAFPDGGSGAIAIQLHTKDGRHYKLEVSDNGRGLPPEIDYRNTATLGMQLVITFVEQLGGSITLDNSHGTHFTINFENEKKAVGGAPASAAS